MQFMHIIQVQYVLCPMCYQMTLKKKLCENAHQGLGRRRKTLFLKSLTSFTTAFEAVIKIHVSHILNNQAAHHYSTHQLCLCKDFKELAGSHFGSAISHLRHLVTLKQTICVASIWRAGSSRPDFKNWTQSEAAPK